MLFLILSALSLLLPVFEEDFWSLFQEGKQTIRICLAPGC